MRYQFYYKFISPMVLILILKVFHQYLLLVNELNLECKPSEIVLAIDLLN